MIFGLRKFLGGAGAAAPQVHERQWQEVEATLPFLDFLPAATRPRLRRLALEILRDKQFHGAHQFEVSDRIMLSIALQAALLILRPGSEAYRGWVGIVVYPGDFLVPRQETDDAGVVHEYREPVLGEAWEGGPVLVSWLAAEHGERAVNVVIHEFAHKLDMQNGDADGLPALPPGMSATRWCADFTVAYEDFCRRVDAGEDTEIDPYASESPGEFFAVLSEAFFLIPLRLRAEYPAVHAQLAAFYGVDPAEGEARAVAERWRRGHGVAADE